MLIPLWLPWAVAVAAGLFSFLAPQEARGIPDLSRRAVAVVAIAVALGVSVDRYAVSESELYDAVERGAALMDRSGGVLTTSQIGAFAEDRLGREVSFTSIDLEDDEDAIAYEAWVREGGAVVCVVLKVLSDGLGPSTVSPRVRAGSC